MTERKCPGLGLLLVAVSAAVFWGGTAGCVWYAYARHQETTAIHGACEELIAHGWEISAPDCVTSLRP